MITHRATSFIVETPAMLLCGSVLPPSRMKTAYSRHILRFSYGMRTAVMYVYVHSLVLALQKRNLHHSPRFFIFMGVAPYPATDTRTVKIL